MTRPHIFQGLQSPLCTGTSAYWKHRPRRMHWCQTGCCVRCPECGFARGPHFQVETQYDWVGPKITGGWRSRMWNDLMRLPFIKPTEFKRLGDILKEMDWKPKVVFPDECVCMKCSLFLKDHPKTQETLKANPGVGVLPEEVWCRCGEKAT